MLNKTQLNEKTNNNSCYVTISGYNKNLNQAVLVKYKDARMGMFDF